MNWNYPVKGEFRFILYRAVNGSAFDSYKSLSGNISTFSDKNVKKGSKYEYSVGVVLQRRKESAVRVYCHYVVLEESLSLVRTKTEIMIKILSTTLALIISIAVFAQTPTPIEGRWDIVVEKDGKQLPSWLEVRHSGNHALIGRFCYAFGSARPISEVKFTDGNFSFAIPPQWEPGDKNMEFNGTVSGDALKGTMVYTDGKTLQLDWC
ncbi:MAG: hypothetical protein WDO15_01650 [Bacteroidota bacterium]